MLTKSEHKGELKKRSEYVGEWKPIEWYNYHHTALGIIRDLLEYLSFRGYDCVVEKGFLLMGYRDRKLRYDRENPFSSICVGVLNTFENRGEYLYNAGQESVNFFNDDSRVSGIEYWFSSAHYTDEGLKIEGDHLPETANFKIVKFFLNDYDDLDFAIEFYRYVSYEEMVRQMYNRNKPVTFSKSIFLNRGSIGLCGMNFPTIQNPGKWLEVYYGSDWNIPMDKDSYLQRVYDGSWK